MYYLKTYYHQYRYVFVLIAILFIFTIVMNVVFRMTVNKAIHARAAQIRRMRMLETRLRNERNALYKERIAFNTDYRVFCEKMRYLKSQK